MPRVPFFRVRQTRRPIRTRDEAPRYTNDAAALEHLFYDRPDPWDFLTDPYEQARLARLGALVQRVPHESVLEIGCAEGVFTAWLTTVAHHVVALDVSRTACARARVRAPQATVLVQDVGVYEPDRRFDLVVCAETLYYMRDPAAVIAALQRLGSYVLISYTRHERQQLDPLVANIPTLVDEAFRYVVRRFPPKKRGCRFLLWGPCGGA